MMCMKIRKTISFLGMSALVNDNSPRQVGYCQSFPTWYKRFPQRLENCVWVDFLLKYWMWKYLPIANGHGSCGAYPCRSVIGWMKRQLRPLRSGCMFSWKRREFGRFNHTSLGGCDSTIPPSCNSYRYHCMWRLKVSFKTTAKTISLRVQRRHVGLG